MMRARSDRMRRQFKTIVFIPTMGFLHEGHLSLIQEGHRHGDDMVVSIFDRDLELLQKQGVNTVFTPDAKEIYGKKFQTYVTLEKLPNYLCAASRPIHFRGVATVVAKLFNTVKPHVAVFGLKDYQQLVVIRQKVRDLDFGIEIIGAPTVREPDAD